MVKHEWAGVFRNPYLDIELLRGCFIEQAFLTHMHDYFVIGLIHAGIQSFTYRATKYITPPGGVFVLNPGEAHTGEAADEKGFNYFALYPTVTHVKKIAGEITDKDHELPCFQAVRIDDAALAAQLKALDASLLHGGDRLHCECLFFGILTSLVEQYADIRCSAVAVRKVPKAIKIAKEYIQDNWSTGVALSDLAACTGLSRYYFLRLFKNSVGLSPHEYLDSIRLIHAKKLIKDGLALQAVAYAAGFSDQSHFTNRFKQYMGFTPGQYAKEMQ